MASRARQFYGDFAGHPRFFDPEACDVHRLRLADESMLIYARVSPGVWVRGVWRGKVDNAVPIDGPELQRKLYEWDQVKLIEVARALQPELPDPLVRDIEERPDPIHRPDPRRLVPVTTPEQRRDLRCLELRESGMDDGEVLAQVNREAEAQGWRRISSAKRIWDRVDAASKRLEREKPLLKPRKTGPGAITD